jgi:triacylglycerol lipase
MPRTVSLPMEETLIAEAIQKGHGTIHCLRAPEGFDKNLAWELANLIRIAYGDYEKFDHNNDPAGLIQEHDTIWLPPEGVNGLVKHFWLSRAREDHSSGEDLAVVKEAIPYKVLAVFTYLAFNLAVPPEPEVDRFGLILERQSSEGRRDLYLVFRGTMEPSEWFNDFQYKQIPFLMPDQGFSGLGEICLGFNKIYTDYRPGLLIDAKVVNKYARWIDEQVRAKVMADHRSICQQHKLSMKDTVHQKLDALLEAGAPPTSLHVTGHSLGAALATICALHASVLCEKKGVACPVDLYTFASPRVGDSRFAKACEERIQAFRIANSEDVVPGIPPATLRVVGEEMSPGPHVEAARLALAALTGGVSNDVFEHVGVPVYFSLQLGEISSNHNMGHTYCSPLAAGLPPSSDRSQGR